MALLGLLSIWAAFAIFVIAKGKGFFLAFAGGFVVMVTSFILLVAYDELSKPQASKFDVAETTSNKTSRDSSTPIEVEEIPNDESNQTQPVKAEVAHNTEDKLGERNPIQIEIPELDLDARMEIVANLTR